MTDDVEKTLKSFMKHFGAQEMLSQTSKRLCTKMVLYQQNSRR